MLGLIAPFGEEAVDLWPVPLLNMNWLRQRLAKWTWLISGSCRKPYELKTLHQSWQASSMSLAAKPAMYGWLLVCGQAVPPCHLNHAWTVDVNVFGDKPFNRLTNL